MAQARHDLVRRPPGAILQKYVVTDSVHVVVTMRRVHQTSSAAQETHVYACPPSSHWLIAPTLVANRTVVAGKSFVTNYNPKVIYLRQNLIHFILSEK